MRAAKRNNNRLQTSNETLKILPALIKMLEYIKPEILFPKTQTQTLHKKNLLLLVEIFENY